MEFKLLNSNLVYNAKVLHVNRNSVVLELTPGEKIFCSSRVYNAIQKNPDIPIYSVQREFKGQTSYWVAILTTL